MTSRLPKEQIPQIKQQLIAHIDSTFPADKKAFAANQVQNMSDEQLEEFLIQNKLIKTQATPQEKFQQQVPKEKQPIKNPPKAKSKAKKKKPKISPNCVFCHISQGTVKSYQIDDNKSAIAVLEIHPVIKGHTIIIPKEHIENSGKIPTQAWSLAKKIARKLKTRFKKANDVKVVSSNIMGHEIINVFPTYDGESLDSERLEPSTKEMLKLQKRLKKKTSKKKKKSKPKAKKRTLKEKSKKESKPKTTQKVSAYEDKPKKYFWIPKRIP